MTQVHSDLVKQRTLGDAAKFLYLCMMGVHPSLFKDEVSKRIRTKPIRKAAMKSDSEDYARMQKSDDVTRPVITERLDDEAAADLNAFGNLLEQGA